MKLIFECGLILGQARRFTFDQMREIAHRFAALKLDCGLNEIELSTDQEGEIVKVHVKFSTRGYSDQLVNREVIFYFKKVTPTADTVKEFVK